MLLSPEGDVVYYICYSTVVSMTTYSGWQQLYLGHTDKVGGVQCQAKYNKICMLSLAEFSTGMVEYVTVITAVTKNRNGTLC